jgi:dTDP-4-amino-4,6-dideoxygalactose transaminase
MPNPPGGRVDLQACLGRSSMTATRISIPITRPFMGPEELAAVQRPLETGWLVQGPFVKEFEEKFSIFTGAAHSVATTSCTTALHLAVAALGLKPGDEVIVPGFTWVATANVVEYMGARPVFVDIDLATFNLDVSRLEAAITPRTVGIIPVHLFGLAADMGPILEIARRHGLWTVEDAACGFGAWYNGQHVGSFGDLGCFSFHPRKSITTGEGGMVTTARGDLAETARSLRDHGASRSDLQRHTESAGYLLADYDLLGYNFRMTDLQGAIGSVQMDRAEWVLGERHRCAAAYDELLRDLDWLDLPVTPGGSVHGYQSYVCLFRSEEPTLEAVDRLNQRRNRLMAALEAEGIATRQGTHAAFMQGFYARKYAIRPESLPASYLADRLSLSLPMYPGMTNDELETVASALATAIDA